MPISVNIQPFGISVTSWNIRWRVLGTVTWFTNATTPSNPQLANNSLVTITVPYLNTVYEVQILSNCGNSTTNSAIIKQIKRGCPTLSSQNVNVTDTTITASFPIATPAPISNHIASLKVEIFQGVTLINTFVFTTTLDNYNTITFSGLNPNTTYTLKSTITYTQSDSVPLNSYPNNATANTQICTTDVLTNNTTVCSTPIILTVTES